MEDGRYSSSLLGRRRVDGTRTRQSVEVVRRFPVELEESTATQATRVNNPSYKSQQQPKFRTGNKKEHRIVN